MSAIDPHAALIYAMVAVSAADGSMADEETMAIGGIVRHLPAFADFDERELPGIAESCAALLAGEDGFDTVLTAVVENLPAKLRETAYAMACDVAAADLDIDAGERAVLQQLRWRLGIDRLTAAAIERGTAARHRSL